MEAEFGPVAVNPLAVAQAVVWTPHPAALSLPAAASSKPSSCTRDLSVSTVTTDTLAGSSFHSLTALTGCTLVHPLASTTPTHWAGSTGLTSQAAAVTTPQSTALTQSKLQLFSKYRAQKTAAAGDNTPPQKKPKSDQIKVLSFTFGTKEQINNPSFFFLQLNSFGRYAIWPQGRPRD